MDEVFAIYDKNRSRTLDLVELTDFFNDIFKRIGSSKRYTIEQAHHAMLEID